MSKEKLGNKHAEVKGTEDRLKKALEVSDREVDALYGGDLNTDSAWKKARAAQENNSLIRKKLGAAQFESQGIDYLLSKIEKPEPPPVSASAASIETVKQEESKSSPVVKEDVGSAPPPASLPSESAGGQIARLRRQLEDGRDKLKAEIKPLQEEWDAKNVEHSRMYVELLGKGRVTSPEVEQLNKEMAEIEERIDPFAWKLVSVENFLDSFPTLAEVNETAPELKTKIDSLESLNKEEQTKEGQLATHLTSLATNKKQLGISLEQLKVHSENFVDFKEAWEKELLETPDGKTLMDVAKEQLPILAADLKELNEVREKTQKDQAPQRVEIEKKIAELKSKSTALSASDQWTQDKSDKLDKEEKEQRDKLRELNNEISDIRTEELHIKRYIAHYENIKNGTDYEERIREAKEKIDKNQKAIEEVEGQIASIADARKERLAEIKQSKDQLEFLRRGADVLEELTS